MTVARLSERVRRDLAYLTYPSREWTIPRFHDGAPVLDVLIVGGGQAGLATAFALKLEHVNNIRIVDRNPRGLEGPWRRFARMRQLRTPKEVTGIDLGIPSLTATGLVRGEIRPSRVEEHQRDRSGRMAGLSRLVSRRARPSGGKQHRGHVDRAGRRPPARSLAARAPERARDVRERSFSRPASTAVDRGAPRPPSSPISRPNGGPILPTRSTSGGLRGKRVGVLGAGANAFDNAAVALEAGAARVDMCLRRAELPRVNPLIWTNFSGMLGHFAELDDLHRWRFMRYILEKPPMPPPQETFWRCRKFDNFAWHTNCAWRAVRYDGKVATVETEGGPFTFDFIIFATGFETDLSARPELAPIVRHIALWRDRFTPPPGEESDLLSRHPYLGPAFEFTERKPGSAPYLGRLHNYTFGAMPSVGLTGGAITGIKYGVRRLVSGLVRDLFREDAEAYYRELIAYSDPELESLEAPLAWIDRLASEALGGLMLGDLLDHVRSGDALARRYRREQVPKSRPKTGSSKHPRTRQVAARSRNRAAATRHKNEADAP